MMIHEIGTDFFKSGFNGFGTQLGLASSIISYPHSGVMQFLFDRHMNMVWLGVTRQNSRNMDQIYQLTWVV